MTTIILAASQATEQSWNPFAPFGVTSWEPLVANLIAFIIVVLVLKKFAFKPIMDILETRRERIAEGEAMRAESEKQLQDVAITKTNILATASAEGQKYIDSARESASTLLSQKQTEAAATSQGIIQKAHEAAELDARRQREELKAHFAHLVAQATTQVTGKILTEDDHRRINEEAIGKI